MKRLLIALVLCIALVGVMVVPAMAASKSIQGNVNLVQKTATAPPAAWDVVAGGASGKYNYSLATGNMISGVFNANGLVAGAGYTLVAFGPYPTVIVLGTGTASTTGNIHIATTPVNITAAILQWDNEYALQAPGAKIWLVPSLDITGTAITTWDPNAILFEMSLVR